MQGGNDHYRHLEDRFYILLRPQAHHPRHHPLLLVHHLYPQNRLCRLHHLHLQSLCYHNSFHMHPGKLYPPLRPHHQNRSSERKERWKRGS